MNREIYKQLTAIYENPDNELISKWLKTFTVNDCKKLLFIVIRPSTAKNYSVKIYFDYVFIKQFKMPFSLCFHAEILKYFIDKNCKTYDSLLHYSHILQFDKTNI